MLFALRLFGREFRHGDVMTLVVALVISITTVTGISLFVDRLQQSFEDQSATLLAADRVVSGREPLPDEWLQAGQDLTLETAQRVSFSSMVFSDTGLQLSDVSAVSANYPLRGAYLTDNQMFGAGRETLSGPEPGEVWLSSRLASLLKVELGDTVQVGEASFKVTRFLVRDPGSAGSAFAIAPRAIIHLDDLDKTEVVQPGSRVRYSNLYAGEADKLTTLQQQIEPQLSENQRWREPRSGGRGIGRTIDRAESFLLLAGTLAVVMSGVAMALASQRYVKRHLTQIAVMKTMGATPGKVLAILGWQMVGVFLIGASVGTLAGWTLQEMIALLLANLLSTELPPPEWSNLWLGLATGLVSLMAFCAPLLMRLLRISPLTVLQPVQKVEASTAVLYLSGLAGMFVLMSLYTKGVTLPLLMMLTSFAVAALIGVMGWVLFRFGRYLTSGVTSGWQIGLAALHRRLIPNLFQLLVFTLIIMLGLVLTGVRTGIVADWQHQLPEDAPNHYLFNIQEWDADALKQETDTLGIQGSPWYPMVRGRVTHHNGTAVSTLYPPETDEPEIYERELNLTWTNELAEDNELLEGEFGKDIKGLSLEVEASKEAGVKLGDELSLTIGGLEYTLPVTSIRKVDWTSMRPNFYLILPQSILQDFPANYVTSVFVKPEQQANFYRMMGDFPTVSMLNVGDMLVQIQEIVEQVSQAIELVLILMVASGGLVLIASVRSTLDERLEEGALLRTLGAGKKLVRQAMLVEFGVLGGVAGLIAAVATEMCLYGLQVFVFELTPDWHPTLWLAGPVAGIILVTMIGLLAGSKVIKVPPMRMLREL